MQIYGPLIQDSQDFGRKLRFKINFKLNLDLLKKSRKQVCRFLSLSFQYIEVASNHASNVITFYNFYLISIISLIQQGYLSK